MYIKLHRRGDKEVIAICDEDVFGKKFSENGLVLDVSKTFYGGTKKDEESIKKILLKSSNINLVGKKCINLAIKLKVINESNILKIKGIPYTFIFNL